MGKVRLPITRAAALLAALCIVNPTIPLPSVHAADKSAYDAARELADKLESAGKRPGAAPTAASPPANTVPKSDPCSLLSSSDVQKYFPKASAATRERTREKYGIVACLWDHSAGRLGVQLTLGAKPGSAAEEARGISAGFVDPIKPGAGKSVRFEKLAGVGDEAVAVVEKADEKQGILSDVAYLYTQRGDTQVMIMAVDLARGDRAVALKTLQALGQAAVSRL